ncbi:hypothetical protein ACTFIR_009323 [Dictyostelium discoideum]
MIVSHCRLPTCRLPSANQPVLSGLLWADDRQPLPSANLPSAVCQPASPQRPTMGRWSSAASHTTHSIYFINVPKYFWWCTPRQQNSNSNQRNQSKKRKSRNQNTPSDDDDDDELDLSLQIKTTRSGRKVTPKRL